MGRNLQRCVAGVVLAGLSVLGGCSKESDDWLIGEWVYDGQATKANLPANIKAAGVPDDVAEELGAELVGKLMSQLEDVRIRFTADEITFFTAEGDKTRDYEVIKRPDANTIVVESPETARLTRSGKYLCIPSTGDVDFKMYFKPVECGN
ncbi:hypothetical protein STSP2_00011 [Anaerohalosphaera lusitana]|uniref:Uncharacterized protein n=1 Tax=Anaerohalosphaera lusitana TaxID=1936003 RepID=A0A1U9NG19_9BACT|nr:hypothetical protein [Anaerohalosphaera lusitana]AQT66873.1 hypothetical protein STSP2_00011 [Anaerohalosphaera lusitana]